MRGLLVLSAAATCASLAFACDDSPADPREDEITGVLAAADEPLIRTRPLLSAGKYVHMTSLPFELLRGSLAVYRHDARAGSSLLSVSRFGLEVPLVPSLGDPHVENFGSLRASDHTLALEPNDFDAADMAPYLWDVRRLGSSMALAAMVANTDDPAAQQRSAMAARDVAMATALGYRTAIEQAATGTPPVRVTAATDAAHPNALLTDCFSRAERDEAIRRELTDFTDLDGTSRRLKRGVADPTDTQNVFVDVPPSAYALLPAAIERWRSTLVAPPPAGDVVLLDAVRELGSGVSSWTRVRLILLVRGPTDDPGDDRLLELKELSDSGIAGLYPPGVHHDDVALRVMETSRLAWARSDGEALWGVTSWLGLPVQIRAETQGQKNLRVSRMVGDRGTPEAIAGLGGTLGEIVARIHTSGPEGLVNARAIYGRIAIDPDGFVNEQADASLAYAQQILADFPRFRHALAAHGLRLGVPFDPSDLPRADFAAILGTPPPPPELP